MKHFTLWKSFLLLCALVVGSNAWADGGTLVSALNGIVSGETYYITALHSSKYYTVPNTTINGQTFTCTEGTYDDVNKILTTASGAGEFVFTAVNNVSNAYYIYNTNLKKYLVATGSKKFGYVDSSSSDYGYWTFSTVSSGGFSGAFSVQHSSKTHYMRAFENSVRCYDGTNNSGVYLFQKMSPCATPTFSPVSGTQVAKGDEVTISSTTTGSTIYYTTDGTAPSTSSAHGTAGEASATVAVNDDVTIKAIAVKTGNNDSEVATANYTVAKAANAITVTGGTTHNIALTGAGAVDSYELTATATHGTVSFAIKSVENLVEDTDFAFDNGEFIFTNTYKGVIVVTASVAATSDYEGAEEDITINCSGDLRTPTYLFDDTENISVGSTIAVANGENIETDGAITLATSNAEIATVDNTNKVITPVAAGTCNITVTTAEGAYYAAGNKTFALNVTYAKGTQQNPYTVAEAIAATPASGTSENVYINGIVSSFYSTSITGDATYHRYYISDDGNQTNELLVFNGKGLNNVAFSSADDLQVGDIITICGGLTTYSNTKEVAANNYITSLKRKADSDLAITSESPVALEITTANLNPTSTITWTTTSTGTMHFSSSAEGVATVSDAGVITAQGAGTATITITQDADNDYKASAEKTVTVNITDNRSACATGIDLTSAKTILKEATGDLAATCTKTDGFTGTIVYSYVSADPDIFYIDGTEYMGAGVGTTTVTVTVTPTGGNANAYKPASQEVAVTVNGTNSITLDPTSKTVAFSTATFDIEATVPTDNYDGTVTAVSSNTDVATVAVDGTTVTVTPKAIGTTTITVTAGTGIYYLATAQAECDVEFTAPAGGTEAAPTGNILLFGESFGDNSGSARDWKDTYSVKSGVSSVYSGITGYIVTNAKQGKNTAGSTKSGLNQSSSGTDASIIIGPLNVADYSNMTLSYKWNAGSTKGTYTTSASYATSATGEYTALTGSGAGATSFVNRTYSLPEAAQVSTLYIKVVWNTSNTQAIIDEIQLKGDAPAITAKLNASGYASFCSQYPLDFSDYATADHSAWQITSIGSDAITFEQVKGKVKGGTGLLLKGEAGATVTLTSADSDNELTGNKLVGTLAPLYVAANDYYGLSGTTFVRMNAGTVKAGKAIIPAGEIPTSAQNLTFVFEDNTTGIESIHNGTIDNNAPMYNISGQRVSESYKGIVIVNGKKVVRK